MDKNEYLKMFYSEKYTEIARFIKSQIYSDKFSDVEDCVQETFFIAVKNTKIKNTEDHPDIKGWLFRIAKNVSAKFNSEYLKNKKNVIYFYDESITNNEEDFTYKIDSDDNLYNEKNWGKLILNIKKALPKNERDLFELKYIKKFSNKEISVILNKSDDAIKSKCSKLKKKVKSLLKS